MRTKLTGVLILVVLMFSYAVTFPFFEQARKTVSRVELQELTLPPFVSKFLALEFRSVAADYLFVRVTQFYGGEMQNRRELPEGGWLWLYSNLQVVTDLDPYFEDPYYFGNAVLTWNTGMFNQANKLLQKGTDARTWDWQLPFFLGFNKFYFLKDNKAGADYILEAAKRRGAPNFLPSLAARLYHQAQDTGIAIAFLKSFYQTEKSEQIRKVYAVRIDALEKILMIEKAVAAYRKKTKHLPFKLDVLVQSGFLNEIPADPYGGTFYIDKDGSITTTSKLAVRQQPQKKQQ